MGERTHTPEEIARQLSDALLKVRPLGGSELFMRVGEEFYADPVVCGREIEELRRALHNARVETALLRKRLSDLTGVLSLASDALAEVDTDARVKLEDASLWEFVADARCEVIAALSKASPHV